MMKLERIQASNNCGWPRRTRKSIAVDKAIGWFNDEIKEAQETGGEVFWALKTEGWQHSGCECQGGGREQRTGEV